MIPVLDGIRILDLSRMLAGPYGTLLLADMGAEIIKIEDPTGGDPTRAFLEKAVIDGQAGYFMSINRGKQSLALDLKSPEGKKIFFDLVAKADVIWENFRPDVTKRLGIDYESVARVKPDIVYCSISGFGMNNVDRPAFDLVLQALGGAMSITGEPGGMPVRMGIPMGDLAGGLFGSIGVLSALVNRFRTGQGQHIDLSLLDCQISLLTYVGQFYLIDGLIPGPVGSAHESVVPYQAFQTRDGFLVLATFVAKFWAGVCQALELEELIDDPRFVTNIKRRENRQILVPILQERLLERDTATWIARLAEHDVPSAPINNVGQALEQEDVVRRDMVVEVEHPVYGAYRTIGNPIKFPALGPENYTPAPILGEHTRAVLRDLLGYADERIEALRAAGVIGLGDV